MTFDMNAAWSNGIAKVRANLQLIAIVGGVFFLLPAIVMALALPDMMAKFAQPNFNPQDTEVILSLLGPRFFITYALALVATFIGYVAMITLMSDNSRPTVGEAIVRGVKALPALFGILIIFLLAYLILFIMAGVFIGGLSVVSGPVAGIGSVIAITAVLVGLALIATRMSMSMAIIALEDTLNPVTAVKRSWVLTAAVQWPLLGFFALLTIAYFVIAIVLGFVVGLALTALGSPVLIGIFNGLIATAVAMILSGVVAATYSQLANGGPVSIRDTFE